MSAMTYERIPDCVPHLLIKTMEWKPGAATAQALTVPIFHLVLST